ncbi:MAG: hypothetical protein D6721_09390 [Gammaproteobacteria bacterium]|nr:MAG: hypothetical protein D6721_09390 [Gammaproteobacteria bacterium]
MDEEIEVLPWDVALEALARETSQRKGRGLRLNDIRSLSREHRIRFDDFMVTLFELVLAGRWHYLDRHSGRPVFFDRATLEGLYVRGRLREEDLQDFDGYWVPGPAPAQ